jgi:hypothetical protein
MNVATAGIDVHGIIAFYVTTACTDILDVAIHCDITA